MSHERMLCSYIGDGRTVTRPSKLHVGGRANDEARQTLRDSAEPRTSGRVNPRKAARRGRVTVTAAILGSLSVLGAVVVAAPHGASAAPAPPTISLGLDSYRVLDTVAGDCTFVFVFLVNGMKGSPGVGWDVLAAVPSHFGPPGLITVTTLTKADNGTRQQASPLNTSHPDDGHEFEWVLHLRNPKGNIVATSNALATNSSC